MMLAAQGMPHRYVDDANTARSYGLADKISSAGAFVALISLVLFAICLVEAMTRHYRREKGRPDD